MWPFKKKQAPLPFNISDVQNLAMRLMDAESLLDEIMSREPDGYFHGNKYEIVQNGLGIYIRVNYWEKKTDTRKKVSSRGWCLRTYAVDYEGIEGSYHFYKSIREAQKRLDQTNGFTFENSNKPKVIPWP